MYTKNPVLWWKRFTASSEFKNELAELAIKLLSIPCSSASVERSFSVQNRIHTATRNLLSNENCEKLLAIKFSKETEDEEDAIVEEKVNDSETESDIDIDIE